MLPTKLRFIWQSCFRGEEFPEIDQPETRNCLWWSCLLTVRDTMSHLYRGSSIDASYQVSVHFAKRFQRRRFLEINQPELPVAVIFVNVSVRNQKTQGDDHGC